MCLVPIYEFACGHETRLDVHQCPNFNALDIDPGKVDCGKVTLEPVKTNSKCNEDGCRFFDELDGQWKCCRCGNRPNWGPRCTGIIGGLLYAKAKACWHEHCEDCRPWKPGKALRVLGSILGSKEQTGEDRREGGGLEEGLGIMKLKVPFALRPVDAPTTVEEEMPTNL